MGTKDEVILPVLAPAEVVAGIAQGGMEPVFADLDPETMSLTPDTVVNQVTVHTKEVYVTPVEGVIGEWERLRVVTEPRGIALRVEGRGGMGKWEKLAPGVRAMGNNLLSIDEQLILGGADSFAESLSAGGLTVGRMPEWRGRKRDYPGMTAIEKSVLVVEDWPEHREWIEICAQDCARQRAFVFDEPLRRLPVRRAVEQPHFETGSPTRAIAS